MKKAHPERHLWLLLLLVVSLGTGNATADIAPPQPIPIPAAQKPASAQEPPTAKALLAAMDSVLQYETRTSTSIMRVITKRRTREYKLITYGRGLDEAAIEYMSPVRDKGTKMLKKGDNMWLYMPQAERTQKISGHMLRQGMMGSDISYEDMMQTSDFDEMYEAKIDGDGTFAGRACWKLVATARDETVSYPKRIIWIDKENNMPLQQELYALSGMLLKTWSMSDIRLIEGRPVAHRMELSDKLRTDSRTEIIVENVSFGVKLEEEVFTLRWLERK